MTEEIIALDLETTGLNPRTDQILELGAARIRNGRVKDTYAGFINIGKKDTGVYRRADRNHR